MAAVLPETVKHVQCYVGLLHAERWVKLTCCSPYIANCVIITKESILRFTRLVLRRYVEIHEASHFVGCRHSGSVLL